MEDILNEIDRGLDARVYQLSLAWALCLPDICGALQSEDGQASKRKYINWYNEYVNQKFNGKLTAEDCYYFRCSFLHQGTTEHEKSNYKKILFVEPHATSGLLHNNVLEGALNIDVRIFCNNILDSVREWLLEIEGSETYKRNIQKTFRRYPNGIKPYIVGIPVYG